MSLDLPSRPAPRTWGVLAFVLLVSLLPLGGAWVLFQVGGWAVVSGVLLVAVVVAALALLLVGVFVRRAGRVRVLTTERGTELPSSRLMTACVLGAGVSVVLFAVSFIASALASGGHGAASGLVMLGAVLVLAVPVLVGLARGRFQRGGLLLTPEAVGQSSYDATATIDWDRLAEVRLVADPGRRLVLRAGRVADVRRSGGPGSLGERPVTGPQVGPQEVSVPLAFLGSDGVLVARVLDFYRRTPAARAELGTDAARARLEQGRTD